MSIMTVQGRFLVKQKKKNATCLSLSLSAFPLVEANFPAWMLQAIDLLDDPAEPAGQSKMFVTKGKRVIFSEWK